MDTQVQETQRYRAKPYSRPYGSGNGFECLTKGWPRSGWKSQHNELTARFVSREGAGEAQINFVITQNHEKRSQSMHGGMVLSEDQAIEFAMQIVPQYIAEAIAAAKAKGGAQ